MTPTRTQLEQWNPSTLLTYAQGWRDLGSHIDDLFSRYVREVEVVNGQYWEGTTAEAAHTRATADRRTASDLTYTIGSLADSVDTGYYAITGNLEAARGKLHAAWENGFTVTDDLDVLDPLSDSDRDEFRQGLRDDLRFYAQLTQQADEDLARLLDDASGALRCAFVSAAALGSDQAATDIAALFDGTITDVTARRIVEATTLTPDQLSAFLTGETVAIPASQMEYLRYLSRALDHLGPVELNTMLTDLPDDTRAGVANALQLLSSENVTVAVVGDADVPSRGGFELLPQGIRDALSRDDLVVHDYAVSGEFILPTTILNGVAEHVAVAEIVSAGDSVFRNGSALDRELLDAGSRYLDAQVDYEQQPPSSRGFLAVPDYPGAAASGGAFFEPIFAAVADDRVALLEHLTVDESDGLVHNMLVHPWTDPTSVTSMFEFGDAEASVADHGDPVDVAHATRSGQIMSTVAEAMSTDDAWNLLSNIPGTDHRSIGEVNPLLVGTIADSMSGYIPRFVSLETPDRPGFDIEGWTDGPGTNDPKTYRGSANVFAALSTGDGVGTSFQARALEESTYARIRFGADPDSPNSTLELETSGQLLALTDRGIEMSLQDRIDDEAARNRAVYDRKAGIYNAITWLGSHVVPKSDLFFDSVSAGGDSFKDVVIGPSPDSPADARIEERNFQRLFYVTLSAMDEIPEEARNKYSSILSENGRILPYYELFSADIPGSQRKLADNQMVDLLSNFRNTDTLEIAYHRVRQS